MLLNLIQYSGIASIVVAWIFVVMPAIIHGIDAKKQSITSITCLNPLVSTIVTVGLILGATLQAIFLWYLMMAFHFSLITVGGLLFLSSNIATILVSLFHHSRYPKAHDFFVRYYFILNPISLAFIGYYASATHQYLFPTTLLLIIADLIGTSWIIYKYRMSAYLEILAFLLMSIWTVIFTFA